MTFVEKTLAACLFALYLMECIFWIRADQFGFTRSSRRAWQKHASTSMSFTLLNRRPLFADPLLLRPGFVRTTSVNPVQEARILLRVGRRLDRLWLLLDICRLQAFTLLVYLPTVMFLHRLDFLWRIVLGLVLVTHIAICTLSIRELRRLRKANFAAAAFSLLCNPLGATRAMDVLSQALFEKYSSTR